MKKKSLLIIGSGYYTLGDDRNFGCILSSVIQWLKENNISSENFKVDFLVKDNKRVRNKTRLIKKHILLLKKNFNFNFILFNKIKYDYDACIIAVPEEHHFFYANIFLKKKIPIICVKPFGKNLLECKKIIDLSKKNNTPIFIDFHKRYDKANLNIGNIVSKNLNQNYQIIINYSQPSNIPNANFRKWSYKTNPFQFLAPHYLDLINFWFKPGDFKLDASAIKNVKKGKKSYEAVTVVIKFKKNSNTILITFNCNWMEPIKYYQKSRQNIEIITNKFHIYSDQAHRGIKKFSKDGYEEPNNYFTFFNENNFSGYGYESFKNFFDKIYFKKNSYLVKLQDHIFVSKVLERVNKLI